MNKKGELTTKQIVTLVILIISFSVILFLLFRLDLGEETNKELCHNSVVMRGNSALPSDSFPLKCETKYLCITEDGSCEGMTNPDIEKVKDVNEAYEVLASEMVDCWWMFGEGKINYASKDWSPNLYCSLCDQIVFDDSLKTNIFNSEQFEEKEFYEYLEKNNLPNSDKSYLRYLTGVTDVDEFEKELKKKDIYFKTINLDSQYYLLTGIYSKISALRWAGVGAAAGAVVAGVVLAVPSGGTSLIFTLKGMAFIGLGAAVGGTGGASSGEYLGTVISGESGNDYYMPTLIEANSEGFKKLKCEDIKTLA